MKKYKIYNQLVSNIYALLKLHAKKVSALESVLGVSAGYLSKLKLKYHAIDFYKFVQIADFFKISIDDLLNHDYIEEYRQLKIVNLQKEMETFYVCAGTKKDVTDD